MRLRQRALHDDRGTAPGQRMRLPLVSTAHGQRVRHFRLFRQGRRLIQL